MDAKPVMVKDAHSDEYVWQVVVGGAVILETFPAGKLKDAYAAADRYNAEMEEVC